MNAAATVRITSRFFLESLLPVVLVLISLFALLAVVHFKADADNEPVIVINIPSDTASTESELVTAYGDEKFSFDIKYNRQAAMSDTRFARAQRHIDAREWAEAQAVFDLMLRDGRTPVLLNEVGAMHYKRGDYAKALEFFNQAIASKSASLETFFNRALTYNKLGKTKKAVKEYKYVISNNPYHFEATFNLGVAYLETKAYTDAIKALLQASKLAGGERKAKALHNLGVAYKRAGPEYNTKAAVAYRAALRIKPDYLAPRFGLAALEPDSNDGQRNAMEIYDEILRLHPGSALAWFLRGKASNLLNDEKAALESYQKAVQFDPNYDNARYNLALQYLKQDRIGDARQQFEKILEHDDTNARAHLQLGRLARADKNLDAALEYYRKALQQSDNMYPEAYLNIGLVYKDKADYQEAIKHYRKALKLKNIYPEAWYNIGLAYSRLDDFDNAEQALRKAVKEKPDYAAAWYNLGILYTRFEHPQKAKIAYKRAITARPNYAKALINLGVLHARTGEYGEAIAAYQAVLVEDKSYTKAWINLGETYLHMARFADAEEAFDAALQLDSENVNVLLSSAKALDGSGDNAGALVRLQDAANRDAGNAEIRLQLARTLKKLGNDADARTALKHAASLAPDDKEIALELRAFSDTLTMRKELP